MELRRLTASFLDTCAVERQLSANTLQAYGYDLADFCAWLKGQGEAPAVTTEHLRDYLESMMVARKLSPSTVRRRIACLRAFFRFLDDRGEMPDPFTGWRLKLPRRKRLPRALSREEANQLLTSARAPGAARQSLPASTPLCVEIRLMISTGIRVGELCKIATGDVSSDGASLRIHGKGSRDRVVYVSNPALRNELRKLTTLRQRLSAGDGPLFVNRNGENLRPYSFRTKLRNFAGQAGLRRRVTPHMLRHTAATLLIESGVDIRIVQRLLGHSSIATTEIYTHVSDEALRKSLERANVLGMLAA
ncbi:phage integrase [Rhodopseudomonas palustris BisB18]|uniref:Phage integrase n=2 Tax=Rhodopseudomonas palustris TaxID=1076 RepID=Q21B93_RHOPB